MSDYSTKKLIDEIESLPIEERTKVADAVLQSLNPQNKELEEKWIITAERRLTELKSGEVAGISGDQVFEKAQKRFSK